MVENYGGAKLSAGFGLHVFTDDECQRIHQASLWVLEKIGIRMESEQALEYYDAAGCFVDKAKQNVKIPPWIAEDALRKAPKSVTLYDRYGNPQIVCEENRVEFITFGEAVATIDFYTKKRRPSTKQDVADIAKLTDNLDHIKGYVPPLHPNDVDHRSATLHCYEALFNYSIKPVFGWGDTPEQARIQIEAAAAVVGGKDKLRERPTMVAGLSPVSPLMFPASWTDPLIEYAKEGLPVGCVPMCLSGGTTPAPFASTVVDNNAEVLAYNVLFQTIYPGCPYFYSTSSTMLDPRLAAAAVGTPELALLSAGVSAMSHFYKLPCMIAGG